ncbi:DUF4303 domain-containing protein [Comamonas testosteroni]|uniref:DUF4303 domain-containing protein n=1 Tax=Comamonas testosteroni TaxID=285 RepID=A0A373FKQ0_COMTE|nr:DUF4303 domain-containing protein [Comamonas testosteroni]RGE44734.1 DUF4303 domain-containing protein [Comamonas testosteroni]
MPAISPPPLDWKQFEQTLFDIYWQNAQAFFAAHTDPTIYALALSGLYREQDGPIYLPTLAANSEQAYAHQVAEYDDSNPQFAAFALDKGQLHSLRWNPPDWEWEELDSANNAEGFEQAGEALIAEANRSTAAHWLRTEARLLKVLISLCKALTKACKSSPWAQQLSPQFAVLICLADAEDAEELARLSLGDKVFKTLFPSHDKDVQRRAFIAALPQAQQLQYHLACLAGTGIEELGLSAEDASLLGEEAEAALFAMDHAQVAHALLPLLEHPGKQWKTAMMLAQLAYNNEGILQALRHHVQQPLKDRSEESGRNWCASALGALGDQHWLQEQYQHHAMPAERAATGIAYPYRAWNSKPGTTALPLNYAPLEQILSLGDEALTQAIEEELEPGSGYCSPRPDDIGEALRGLQSTHVLVRMHAAWILGERSLGAEAGKRILPALAQALRHDTDGDVRYQAMLGLQDWKKASSKHLSDIQYAAEHDASDDVRELAQEWLDEFH